MNVSALIFRIMQEACECREEVDGGKCSVL